MSALRNFKDAHPRPDNPREPQRPHRTVRYPATRCIEGISVAGARKGASAGTDWPMCSRFRRQLAELCRCAVSNRAETRRSRPSAELAVAKPQVRSSHEKPSRVMSVTAYYITPDLRQSTGNQPHFARALPPPGRRRRRRPGRNRRKRRPERSARGAGRVRRKAEPKQVQSKEGYDWQKEEGKEKAHA